MDDRSFDSLVRSLASGANRRQILKGLLGLGGAAIAGAGLSNAEAARRPTPTPKPVTCPGRQTWNGSVCICPADAPGKCGPDCCTEGVAPIDTAGYSECCDNACCFGHCYGEELCCPYPREFCAVTGDCCPEGWTCCPDFGCIAPDQCCTAADCVLQECFAAVCPADHFCAYVEDCVSGGGECCEAPACFRSDCQNDGSCAEPVVDCRIGTGCCTADACFRSDCLENGLCGEDVPDCRTGEGCCVIGQTCLQSSGACCTPLTCANVPAYTCSATFSDGCGGFLDCSDVCDERLTCLDGLCRNTSATCYDSYCNDAVLGGCNTTGICRTRLNGTLVCTSGDYSTGSDTGVCGDCTSDANCDNPGDFCARDSGWVTGFCPGCTTNGTGCSIPY